MHGDGCCFPWKIFGLFLSLVLFLAKITLSKNLSGVISCFVSFDLI